MYVYLQITCLPVNLAKPISGKNFRQFMDGNYQKTKCLLTETVSLAKIFIDFMERKSVQLNQLQ